ncbi:MAG: hypothetical protein WC475_04925 [Candidatus Paceibacterota bacterium]
MKSKKGLVWHEIGWWVIGLAILAMVIISVLLAKQRGVSLLEELKNLFRFGK